MCIVCPNCGHSFVENESVVEDQEDQKEETGLVLAIEHGALLEVPVYERHSRGKNWMAVINLDPASPGGLGRTFAEKAHGDYIYLTEVLRAGAAVEFGADYYSSSGHKHSSRWYGVCTYKDETKVCFIECQTGREAIKVAEALVVKEVINNV